MGQVYIFGTSGFARETADIVDALGDSAVFVASGAAERASWRGGKAVVLEESVPDGAACAIGIGDNAVRRKVATRHSGRLTFVNLIHPSASFGTGQRDAIERARGIIVCAGARFTNSIAVGDFGIFNLNATIGHDCVIEDYVNLAPGATVSGNVHLCEGVWVGTNAAINQGSEGAPLTVGAGTTIGSGSVVVRDCEPAGVYVGIPAKRQ